MRALKLIFDREDINPLEKTPASQLPIQMRLLYSIISRIMFSKIGHFDFISERDLILMHYVILEILVNLLRLMMTYMCDAANKVNASLPYGMVITLIFRKFRIPISKEEPKKVLRHTDIYKVQTLHRMGFTKINGHWERQKMSQE